MDETEKILNQLKEFFPPELADWKIALNKTTYNLGQCDYQKKTIFLSQYHLTNSPLEEVLDTCLHEIAHALTQGHHHDYFWRKKFIELGGSGERCGNAIPCIPCNYIYYCPVCGHEKRTQRILKVKYSCGKCSPIFNEKYLLIRR